MSPKDIQRVRTNQKIAEKSTRETKGQCRSCGSGNIDFAVSEPRAAGGVSWQEAYARDVRALLDMLRCHDDSCGGCGLAGDCPMAGVHEGLREIDGCPLDPPARRITLAE